MTPTNRSQFSRPAKTDNEGVEMMAGLSTKLSTIDAGEVELVKDTAFKNVKLVGGYNWIDREDPSIVVPGIPRVWSGNTGRLGQLKPDIQIPGYKEMANQNGYRLLPDISTLEPIFHSLTSPSDMTDIDLVTDRNSLRKLYGIFTPDAMYGQKPFRIDGQFIGNTVLFCRWEDESLMKPRLPHPFVFAKAHELATSENVIEGITSCHQIVRYQFGGNNLLVRFELDAATETPPKPKLPTSTASNDLADLLSKSSVKATKYSLPPSSETKGGINIHRTHLSPPPLSTFIEKKTRSVKGNLDYVDIYGQLVFSQTPNLYVAKHMRGDFQTLEKVCLGQGRLKDIAYAADEVLGKVAAMLDEMMAVVKEHEGVSFVWSGKGEEVEVWEYNGHPPLSNEARRALGSV